MFSSFVVFCFAFLAHHPQPRQNVDLVTGCVWCGGWVWMGATLGATFGQGEGSGCLPMVCMNALIHVLLIVKLREVVIPKKRGKNRAIEKGTTPAACAKAAKTYAGQAIDGPREC